MGRINAAISCSSNNALDRNFHSILQSTQKILLKAFLHSILLCLVTLSDRKPKGLENCQNVCCSEYNVQSLSLIFN